jgi:hypothetical protein
MTIYFRIKGEKSLVEWKEEGERENGGKRTNFEQREVGCQDPSAPAHDGRGPPVGMRGLGEGKLPREPQVTLSLGPPSCGAAVLRLYTSKRKANPRKTKDGRAEVQRLQGEATQLRGGGFGGVAEDGFGGLDAGVSVGVEDFVDGGEFCARGLGEDGFDYFGNG